MHEQKNTTSQLRKRLQDCEDYIIRIAKPFEGYWDKATEEVINDHLGTTSVTPSAALLTQSTIRWDSKLPSNIFCQFKKIEYLCTVIKLPKY